MAVLYFWTAWLLPHPPWGGVRFLHFFLLLKMCLKSSSNGSIVLLDNLPTATVGGSSHRSFSSCSRGPMFEPSVQDGSFLWCLILRQHQSWEGDIPLEWTRGGVYCILSPGQSPGPLTGLPKWSRHLYVNQDYHISRRGGGTSRVGMRSRIVPTKCSQPSDNCVSLSRQTRCDFLEEVFFCGRSQKEVSEKHTYIQYSNSYLPTIPFFFQETAGEAYADITQNERSWADRVFSLDLGSWHVCNNFYM